MNCLEYVIVVLASVVLIHHQVQGDLIFSGCTEAYVHITCPGDDHIDVMDTRIAHVNNSAPCVQHLPSHLVQVPQEKAHLCPEGENNNCIYFEDICHRKSECLFYVSPHLIAGEEMPTENSEVIIKYRCTAGQTRKAGVVIIGLLTTAALIAVFLVGGLILYREFFVNSDPKWNNFSNEPTTSTERRTTNMEHIQVDLQAVAQPAGSAYGTTPTA